MMNKVIEATENKRWEMRMNNKRFAAFIGITPEHWDAIKHERKKLNAPTLKLIGEAIPELKELIRQEYDIFLS